MPQRERGMNEAVLPAGHQRIHGRGAPGRRPVMAKQVRAEPGVPTAPARSRLRALRPRAEVVRSDPGLAGSPSRTARTSPSRQPHESGQTHGR